jgi:hypothetical protein
MSGVREGRIELKVSGERVRHRLSIAARRSTFTKRSQEVLWHQSVSNLVQPSFTKSSLAELITARPHWIASCAISCWRDFGKGALSLASPSLHGRNTAHELITIVTYDRRTIPPLLKTWAEEERTHGGVVFVDEKTISPADIGGLVSALTRLARQTGNWDWTNRVYFLRR